MCSLFRRKKDEKIKNSVVIAGVKEALLVGRFCYNHMIKYVMSSGLLSSNHVKDTQSKEDDDDDDDDQTLSSDISSISTDVSRVNESSISKYNSLASVEPKFK